MPIASASSSCEREKLASASFDFSMAVNPASASVPVGKSTTFTVDVNPTKLEWARNFGATQTVNAREVDPVAEVRRLTDDGWDGGVEFAYEATGVPVCTEQAVKMLSYGGTATTIGFPAASDAVNLNLGDMATGVYWNKAALHVCHAGDTLPSHDFPLLANLYLNGQLELDKMITRKIKLDEVEDAFHEMETGDVIRSVIML